MKRLCAAALVIALLTGCGNKGPLYLPDKAPPNPPAKQEPGK